MSQPKVVHCKRAEPGSFVLIDRTTKWGNPFSIGKDGTREEVIQKYDDYFRSNMELIASLDELTGKDLGCWCAPSACHGDVLLRYANGEDFIVNQLPVDGLPMLSYMYSSRELGRRIIYDCLDIQGRS